MYFRICNKKYINIPIKNMTILCATHNIDLNI